MAKTVPMACCLPYLAIRTYDRLHPFRGHSGQAVFSRLPTDNDTEAECLDSIHSLDAIS